MTTSIKIRFFIYHNCQLLADIVWDFADEFNFLFFRSLFFAIGTLIDEFGFLFLTNEMKNYKVGEFK